MRIGSIMGIVIKVNPFFLLLLPVASVYGQLIPTLVVFAVVLWHEAVHVLTALYYGMRVVEIEILPFGGVARMDDLMQFEPHIEAAVAAVGPISNLVLLGIFCLWHNYYPIDPDWMDFIARANISMAALNLLPALPLDGGRILRSRLISSMGIRRATEIAALIGQLFAVGFILIGLAGIFFYTSVNAGILILIGFFVVTAAQKEKEEAVYVFLRYLTQKQRQVRSKRVMMTKELVATSEASVGEVLQHFTPSYFHFIWIVDLNGELIGVMTEFELINSLLEEGIHGKLSKLVKHRV